MAKSKSKPGDKRQRQIRSRPPLERMMRIHQLIGNGEYPNRTAVAKEFEVSTPDDQAGRRV